MSESPQTYSIDSSIRAESFRNVAFQLMAKGGNSHIDGGRTQRISFEGIDISVFSGKKGLELSAQNKDHNGTWVLPHGSYEVAALQGSSRELLTRLFTSELLNPEPLVPFHPDMINSPGTDGYIADQATLDIMARELADPTSHRNNL
jgi:hypothetical protein